MLRLVLSSGEFFNSRIRYIWQTFLTYYRAEHEIIELTVPKDELLTDGAVTVYYGPESGIPQQSNMPCLIILHDPETEAVFRKRNPYNSEPAYIDNIPVLFNTAEAPRIQREENRIICSGDLLATAFFFLSAFQEYIEGSQQDDQFGRFSYQNAYLERYKLVEVPVVNLIFDLLARLLEELGLSLERVSFPGEANCAVILSHDVDRVFYYYSSSMYRKLRCALAELIRYRRLYEAMCYFEGIFFGEKDNFRRMLRLHGKHDARSSYNFVFQKEKHPRDPDYLVSMPEMADILGMVHKSGNEIGIHGSFESIMKGTFPDELNYSKSVLGDNIIGGRIHYLRYRIQPMFKLFESIGLSYDNSVMFPESGGYRTGFGLPHQVFDHETNGVFSTLLMPLNLMDTTYVDSRYLNLGVKKFFTKAEAMLEEAVSRRLCLSILTHIDFYMISNRRGIRLYNSFLEKAKKKGALLTDCRTIYHWWKSLNIKK